MKVDTIDERLALFGRMLEQAGVDVDSPTLSERELRAAVQRCLGCQAGDECRAWVAEASENQPPPGFCRNVEPFARWAERQADIEFASLSEAVCSLDAAGSGS
ncbi:DUF6455 family protein [Ancylobacter sp. MQZ15Z-1]|uniref:DUF6455 family protein n=1 Tax=Ancylobacter mangrovi TaxID=2972472 RepID=A0A9X2PIA7_9HYPH|nr:DUF6455 family protein [Ancylobacter mangrovi]MCS0496635.1 DUF6455 family protein [Ancylobacter mangrovi]